MAISDQDLETIEGAFIPVDMALFRLYLEADEGDLAEMGVYYGKSAALIGSYLRPGETFTVADLWEQPARDGANESENTSSYPGLNRAAFEANYRRVVGPLLPTIVQGESSTIADTASHGTHRFVHIDASHLYDHVVLDIRAARALLKTDGVVVFDDYRTAHAPGVAAAAWEAVANGGLRPFALTDMKMYATWGDASRHLDRIVMWAGSSPFDCAVDSVAGHDLARLTEPPRPQPRFAREKRYVPEVLWPVLSAARKRLGR